MGIAHKTAAHPADVNQPIALDADVHKRAEVHNVAHRSPEPHPLAQVFDVQHVAAQDGAFQAVAGVAAGARQRVEDVLQRGLARSQLLRQGFEIPFPSKVLQRLRQLWVSQRQSQQIEHLVRYGVALRVDGGIVQRRISIGQAQEARCLLEGLGA